MSLHALPRRPCTGSCCASLTGAAPSHQQPAPAAPGRLRRRAGTRRRCPRRPRHQLSARAGDCRWTPSRPRSHAARAWGAASSTAGSPPCCSPLQDCQATEQGCWQRPDLATRKLCARRPRRRPNAGPLQTSSEPNRSGPAQAGGAASAHPRRHLVGHLALVGLHLLEAEELLALQLVQLALRQRQRWFKG